MNYFIKTQPYWKVWRHSKWKIEGYSITAPCAKTRTKTERALTQKEMFLKTN